MKSVVYLAVAILFEVFGTTMLKLSNGFTVLLPSLGVIVGFGISFTFFGIALKGIALSTAYAVWSGLGTALTALMGMLLFGENMSFVKLFALGLIIVGVAMLNKSNDPPNYKEDISTQTEAEAMPNES